MKRTVTAVALAFAFALALPAQAQIGGLADTSSAPITTMMAKADAAKTNFSTDVTDVWWPDSEPGWGIFMIQNGEIIFASIFVYNSLGQPTFYVAAMSNSGGPWSGPLSQTTGPFFGGPFNPTSVIETEVGTMTFTLDSIGTGTLTYNVGATSVTKTINRQALALEDNSGSYMLIDSYHTQTCADVTGTESGTLTITQTGTSSTWTINWSGNICTFPLTYSQLGRFGFYTGTMSCSNGVTGTATWFEVHNRVKQVNGRYIVDNSLGCHVTGRFAAMSPIP